MLHLCNGLLDGFNPRLASLFALFLLNKLVTQFFSLIFLEAIQINL